MWALHRTSLRTRLVALVLLGFLPTFGLLMYAAFNNRSVAVSRHRNQALERARAMAGSSAKAFEEASLILHLLAEGPTLRSEDPEVVSASLASVLRNNPLYANMGIIRADGTLRASLLPVPAGTNLTDRTYFQRALAGGGFEVGTFQIGRVTGRPSVNAALRIEGAPGEREVLFAALDLNVLCDRSMNEALPENVELLMLDRDGRILIRRPLDGGFTGRGMNGADSVLLSDAEGTATLDDVEGEARIYGHAPVKRGGGEPLAFVAVGFSESAVAAAANSAMWTTLFWIALLTGLALLAAFVFSGPLIVKPLRQLTGLAEKIRDTGDLSLRAGPPYSPSEVGELEAAFDRMTLALEEQRSETRSREVALRQQETLFRQMAEAIDGVFWIKEGTDRPVSYVSPAFERIWGLTPEQLYEKPSRWKDSIHPSDRDRVLQSVARHETEGRYEETYRIQRADGSVRWIHDRAFAVKDESGAVAHVYGIAEDVTRAKDLELQFQQAQRMEAVGRLAAGVAHDFNNLLTVIMGYGQLLHRDLKDTQQANMEEILKAGEHAGALTRQLLTFGRRQVISPEVVNLRGLLADVGKMVQRLVGPGVEVISLLDRRAGQIHADPNQVRQVVMNLAVNARDAMPGGGRITIETYNVDVDEDYTKGHIQTRPGPYVVLAVSDTGIGMDEATRQRIFEPFFTTKAEGKGTGLGLATVHGIVKQVGGDIFVYSEPGQGTTFKVYFPRIEAPVPPTAEDRARAVEAAGSRTILLVEDAAPIRALAYQALKEVGHTVLAAGSAEEGLVELDGFGGTVEVLVTDLGLPGKDGITLALELQARIPNLNIVLMSGYTEASAAQGGKLPDGMAYLPKPFGPRSLQEKVAEVVRANEANRRST